MKRFFYVFFCFIVFCGCKVTNSNSLVKDEPGTTDNNTDDLGSRLYAYYECQNQKATFNPNEIGLGIITGFPIVYQLEGKPVSVELRDKAIYLTNKGSLSINLGQMEVLPDEASAFCKKYPYEPNVTSKISFPTNIVMNHSYRYKSSFCKISMEMTGSLPPKPIWVRKRLSERNTLLSDGTQSIRFIVEYWTRFPDKEDCQASPDPITGLNRTPQDFDYDGMEVTIN